MNPILRYRVKKHRAAVGEGRDSYRAAYQELFTGYELDALVRRLLTD